MKEGDKLVQLVIRRDALKRLWLLLSSPELTQRDHLDWLDYYRAHKN